MNRWQLKKEKKNKKKQHKNTKSHSAASCITFLQGTELTLGRLGDYPNQLMRWCQRILLSIYFFPCFEILLLHSTTNPSKGAAQCKGTSTSFSLSEIIKSHWFSALQMKYRKRGKVVLFFFLVNRNSRRIMRYSYKKWTTRCCLLYLALWVAAWLQHTRIRFTSPAGRYRAFSVCGHQDTKQNKTLACCFALRCVALPFLSHRFLVRRLLARLS